MLIPWNELLVPWLVLLSAYVIFGISGFGTALVAAPLLAFYMPVPKVIPLLALLDFAAALITFLHDRKNVSWPELKRLVPLMIIGSLAGVTILLYAHPDFLQLALGVFVIAYAFYSLSGYKMTHSFGKTASIPFGLVGGVFSALFGSGGFLYAIYLMGRLKDKTSFRVTQSLLIKCSTFTRAILFFLAGVYDRPIVLTVLICLPAMVIGLYIGRHINLKLSKEQFLRVIYMIILFSGIGLLVNYFTHRF
jgi:uncharacterized protein